MPHYTQNARRRRRVCSRLTTSDGRPVAQVRADDLGTLYSHKTISASRHMLRSPYGIAMDAAILAQAVALGVRYHVVTDRESGVTWCADHYKFERFGVHLNRGFGHQVVLPMEHWDAGFRPAQGDLFAQVGGGPLGGAHA